MNALRRWRLKRNLTLDQLSEKSGLTRDTISRIENGRMARSTTIGKLANALEVEPEELEDLMSVQVGKENLAPTMIANAR
jgi:transcriptional regulator with XRE-family HTH domain